MSSPHKRQNGDETICVIIAKEAGKKIDQEILEACYLANPDGFGVAWAKNGKIGRYKGMLGDSEIVEVCKAITPYPAVIHFRWATHGLKNKDNCHPFLVGRGEIAMAHNGVFSGVRPDEEERTKEWSDTRVIASVLNNWTEEILRRSIKTFEEWHGQGNRTAFLFKTGEILRTGSWDNFEGLMFSNLNWKWRGKYQQNWSEDYFYDSRSTKTSRRRQHNTIPFKSGESFVYRNGFWMSEADAKAYDEAKKNQSPQTQVVNPCPQALYYPSQNVTSATSQPQQPVKTDSAKTASSVTETQAGNAGSERQVRSHNPMHPLDRTDQVLIRVMSKTNRDGKHRFTAYFWDEQAKPEPRVRGTLNQENLEEFIDGWLSFGRDVKVVDGPKTHFRMRKLHAKSSQTQKA